jgi:hypothetical protein
MDSEKDHLQENKPQMALEYREQPGGVFRTYCNNVMMASTGFDVRVIFGEVIDVLPDKSKAIVEQRAQVTMTWLEAKLIGDFLQANVKAHEELNGPLKLPKNIDKILVPDTFQMVAKES